MVTMIISHEVKNYADFKKVFDEDEASRSKNGINIKGVYQETDNANKITVVSEAVSAEAAKAFSENPELKATMEKAGITSKPEIKILNKV